MQWTQFQYEYSAIAGLLPANFMTEAERENTLRRAIEHDRTDYLEILDTLAQRTPADEIRKDPNRLTSKTNFQSFYAELKAYVAMKHWVFVPHPADVQGSQGKPDYEFNIGELDVEVASRTAWDKTDNVVVALEDKLRDTPYISIITLKDEFIKIPYTGSEIDHNEQLVDDILDRIDGLNTPNLPPSISNDGFHIEFQNRGASGSVIRWEQAEEIPLDPEGRIADQLKDKVSKQRGGWPLLIFYDADVSFLDPRDMQQLVHGTASSGPSMEVSDRVNQHRSVWGDYLQEQGYIPESGRTTYLEQVEPDDPRYDLKHVGDSCICSGDEGLFADPQFDRVAGVLFVDKPGYGHFFPNFYSETMNFRQLYRDISRNMETRTNELLEFL